VQGVKIGVVNSHHRNEILKIHAKAPSQCDAAGDSHVEANSDPIEGQRKLGVVMPPVPMASASDAVHGVSMQQIAASAVFTASEAALPMPETAASVMARVVQAATNPTEGERMLQASFGVERSVVGEGGQAVLVQQVQE